MNIIIPEKSPVHGKLTRLGAALKMNPALLAAGICHAALNPDTTPADDAPAPAPAPAELPAIPPAQSMGLFDGVQEDTPLTIPTPAPANA